MHYFVYLDEFGHIGPYISKTDKKHHTSPIFGLGGLILPAKEVRTFSSFFFQLKNSLCCDEISSQDKHPSECEVKGSYVFRPKNLEKYPQLRRSVNRLLNQIELRQGQVFYVGIKKYMTPDQSNSEKLYCAVLKEAIKRIDKFASQNNATVSIIMDQVSEIGIKSDFRRTVVKQANVEMYGASHRSRLTEAPIHVESNLFQTVQCADWLCSLITKIRTYENMPEVYPEYEVFHKYFNSRLETVAPLSGIRTMIPRR